MRIRAILALFVFAVVSTAHAQIARIRITVVDPRGEPIEGVQATITTPAMESYVEERTTNARGEFIVSHTDPYVTYHYKLEKDGYQPAVYKVDPAVGATVMKTLLLKPAEAGGEAAAGAAPTGSARAIKAYNEGVVAQDAGDLETAAQRYAYAMELDEDLAAAQTALGAVRFLQKDYQAAVELTEQALELNPNDARALQIRFDAYRALGETDKADQAAEDLKAVGGASDTARRVFNEGVDALNAGDRTEALSKFEQAVDLDATLVPAYLALARLTVEGTPDRTLLLTGKALQQEPGNLDALRLRFRAAAKTGDEQVVTDTLDTLVEVSPADAAMLGFQYAQAAYDADRMDLTRSVLEQVVTADPEHYQAHFLLGLVLFNGGSPDEAATHFRRYLELAPEDHKDRPTATELLDYIG